jgi:hypothetical protein
MNAGNLRARPSHELAERKLHGSAHESIDGQRPVIGIDTRHAEMAQHDCILDSRHAIGQLMRLKGVMTVGAGGVELRRLHFDPQFSSLVSMVMSALKTLDTGHPALAVSAAVLKASGFALGTLATTSR